MTTLCFLTWTNGRLSKEIQAEEQAWQQSGGKHGASEVPVFHSMTFGYTGCKVNKSGFRREMWVSLHRCTVGNKRKEWTSLLGKSKEIENIQIGSGNTVLTGDGDPVKEAEKEPLIGESSCKSKNFPTRICLTVVMLKNVLLEKDWKETVGFGLGRRSSTALCGEAY